LIQFMLEVAGIAAAVVMGLALVAWFFGRRRVMDKPIRDVLILAAHQDDCVIMGGEYAIEAVKAGRQVRVMYLTCGDREVGSERARVRMQEAVAAWRVIGVEETKLECLGLVNSPLNGPSLLNENDVATARGRLQEIIAEAPKQAVIVIPATGESHQDHRTLRKLALEALRMSGRTDLMVLETPEYNSYYSLRHSPGRTLNYLLRCLPLMGRIATNASCGAGFIHGGARFVLTENSQRQMRRHEMLRAFKSENPEKLIRLFGHPASYRVCPVAMDGDDGAGYLQVGENRLGVSVLIAWVALACIAFSLLYVAAALARRYSPHELLPRVVVIGAAALLLIWTLIRRMSLERRGIEWAAAAGLTAGSLGPVN
jgi:LmbE family N-acetylglucosaminyl deacetylase